MNVSLTTELEHYIEGKVATGLYSSASEVMRDALRLMEEKDAMRTAKIEMLKSEINKGMSSIKQGKSRPLDIEAIKTRGRKQLLKES